MLESARAPTAAEVAPAELSGGLESAGASTSAGATTFSTGMGVLESAGASVAAGEAPTEMTGGLAIDVDASLATLFVKKDSMLSCYALLSRCEFFFDDRTGGIVPLARQDLG